MYSANLIGTAASVTQQQIGDAYHLQAPVAMQARRNVDGPLIGSNHPFNLLRYN
ncbi:hypothetical protein NST69_15515 [Paenibacillus sp. FSL P2-0089]|uniref:hypothetical protein n=1 Tax=Paenibacillus sp. FSL P2-0089 TaxID=2954526 RepID=UPI00315ACC30